MLQKCPYADRGKTTPRSASRGCLRSFSDSVTSLARNAPVDAERRIVPGKAPLVLRRIVVGRFIQNLGIGLQRHIAVRKADRHPQLAPVRGRQLCRRHVGRTSASLSRISTQTSRTEPLRNPHELALRARRHLEMQAAQHALACRAHVVVLHERRIDAVRRKQVGAEGFGEKPAMIGDPVRRNQKETVDIEALKIHLTELIAAKPPARTPAQAVSRLARINQRGTDSAG